MATAIATRLASVRGYPAQRRAEQRAQARYVEQLLQNDIYSAVSRGEADIDPTTNVVRRRVFASPPASVFLGHCR